MRVVADTSALVSCGVVADHAPNPLDRVLAAHDLFVPTRVLDELEATAADDDASGRAATAVLDRRDQFVVRNVDLDETFPLDDGENAAVRLVNDVEATQFYCDEFNRLAFIDKLITKLTLEGVLLVENNRFLVVTVLSRDGGPNYVPILEAAFVDGCRATDTTN